MKKTVLLFALFIGLLITSSGFNRTSLNTSIGKSAPDLALDKIEQVIKQNEDSDKYVLLAFWSASDGASRAAVNNYNSWINNNRPANIDFVSVNFDKSESLFHAIVKQDSLDPSKQFNVSGNIARQIINDYHLDDGYGSLLIDPEGVIVAHNPTDSRLKEVAI